MGGQGAQEGPGDEEQKHQGPRCQVGDSTGGHALGRPSRPPHHPPGQSAVHNKGKALRPSSLQVLGPEL